MNIVLTGASRGIGYETSKALCNSKIDNLILIARNTENLLKLKKECSSINGDVKIQIISCDLEDIIENDTIILDKLEIDSLDILINNAGWLLNKPFIETDHREASKLFNINVLAPSLLMRILYNLLNKSEHSHILNISSMGGYQGSSKFSGLSYYSSSKAAMACITECLAVEFATTNIKVNCLALGAVNTEMLKEAFPDYKAPVNAKEMGEFIAEFALNGHTYFNGKILPVSLSTP